MAAKDWPALVGGVSPDPWVEGERLTSGDPAAINGLAATFESAAEEAGSATQTGGNASLATGEAYVVDGDEVHIVGMHTKRTRDLLSGGGTDLERIGQILRGIGSDLSYNANKAAQKVTTLEGQLQAEKSAFDRVEQQYRTDLASATVWDHLQLTMRFAADKAAYVDRSVDLAQAAGQDITTLVSDYDDELGARSRELTDLGYTVPADINEGAGDVESDPDAGAHDARTVADALAQDLSQQSLAEIDAAAGQMRAINAKVEAGEALTAEERAYLTQFYNTLGADNLARLPDYLSRHPPSVSQGAADESLQQFGDSIMNLSQGARYESLPAPVRELLDARVGQVNPDTGLRYPNGRFLDISGYPEGSTPGAYMMGGGMTGLDRYRGITDVLSASDREPGDALATELVRSAVQVRQDLNAVQENARWVMSGTLGGGTDDMVHQLDQLTDDAPASDALSLAARNVDASAAALNDDHLRPAVLGLNWEDARGAADLVTAGTERDPAAGGGKPEQAAAALAVVREVGGDRDGYLNRMSDPIKDAVNGVGVRYLDAFSGSAVDHSVVISDRTDAMGRSVGESFQLSAADRDHFLQFVSGTGEDRAVDFQRQAKLYSQLELAGALRNGDQSNVQLAMERAGRLDGAISQANFDYTADVTNAQDEEKAAANRAATIDSRANQGAWNTVAAIGKEALTSLLPGGGLVKAVGGPALSILTEIAKGGVGMATLPDAPPPPELSNRLEELRRGDSQAAFDERNLLIANAMDMAGVFGQDRPEILVADADHDGRVDPARSNSQNLDALSSAVTEGLDRWSTEHGAPGTSDAPDVGSYTDARSSTFSGAYDGPGAPARSGWSGGDGLYYGDAEAPDPKFGQRTDDPRKLDDPAYNVRSDTTMPR